MPRPSLTRLLLTLAATAAVLSPKFHAIALAEESDPAAVAELARLESARQSVRLSPENGVARLELASLYLARSNWPAARDELEAALRYLPSGQDSLRAAHLHARVLLEQGLKMRATRELSELTRHPGAPAGASHDLALLWHQDRFVAEALALELQAVESSPDDPALLRQAATWWKEQDQYDLSLRLLERLAEAGGADAEDYFQLGLMAHRLGEMEESRRAYEECLARNPEHPEASYNLALVLRESGEENDAVARFERVLTLRPKYEPAYFELGGYLLELGRKRDAIDVFERYLGAGEDSLAKEEAAAILEQLRTGRNPWADPAADSLRQILGIPTQR